MLLQLTGATGHTPTVSSPTPRLQLPQAPPLEAGAPGLPQMVQALAQPALPPVAGAPGALQVLPALELPPALPLVLGPHGTARPVPTVSRERKLKPSLHS